MAKVIHKPDTLAMRIPHYIVKNHNGVYYFRYVIPESDRQYFPNNKREFRRSLKTRSKSEAIKQAKFYWVSLMSSKENNDNPFAYEADMRSDRERLRHGTAILNKLDLLWEHKAKTYDDEPFETYRISLNEYDKKCLHAATEAREERKEQTTIQQPALIPTTPAANIRKDIRPIVGDYLEEKQRFTTPKTCDTYRQKIDLFIKITAITYVDEITPEVVRRYNKIIAKIPPRTNQNKQLIGESIDYIISLGLDPISNKTLKTNIVTISAFLKWLSLQDYIDNDLSSILEVTKKSAAKKSNENRAIFTDSDLAKMFSIPEYQHGFFHDYPFRYWLPLLGLYTGARSNELCQLHVDDICKEEGIHIIKINDYADDKKVKTSQSNRVIPIHKKLIELGLLDYVKLMKDQGEQRIFPQLTPDHYGSYTRKFSRFFNAEYKKHVGLLGYCQIERITNKGRKDFHSFRHTFVNTGKQLQINDHIIKQLVGHKANDITFDVYGKNYNIQLLKTEIDKIKFDVPHPQKWRYRC